MSFFFFFLRGENVNWVKNESNVIIIWHVYPLEVEIVELTCEFKDKSQTFSNEVLKKTNLMFDIDATNMFMLFCRTIDLVYVLVDSLLIVILFLRVINCIHQHCFNLSLLIFSFDLTWVYPNIFHLELYTWKNCFFSLLLLEVLHYAMSLIKTVSEYNSSQHLFTINIKIIYHVAQFFPLAQLLDTCPSISHWSPFTTGLSFTSITIYVVQYNSLH